MSEVRPPFPARSHFVACDGQPGPHRLHYLEWGDSDNPWVLICVHGLTRNSHDFDNVATDVQGHCRVICPDMPGRGQSDWLPEIAHYNYSVYLEDIASLLSELHLEQVDWLGTSMGGVMGILLASQPNSPIRRLLLNDVGPFIPKSALDRIYTYAGLHPRFNDLQALEHFLRAACANFGPITDIQWRLLATHSSRRLPDSTYALHYDPAISEAFRQQLAESISFWPVWDKIHCPVTVLRGANSDILLPETAAEMQVRGPKARVIEIPECGHAPSLTTEEQIAVVREWLLSPEFANMNS